MTPARRRPAPERSFYETALAEAGREEFEEARELVGIDDEVALLRLLLRQAVERQHEDSRVVEGAVRSLIQALLAQRRLSPQQADDLGDSIASVFEQIADLWKEAPDA